MKQDLALFKTKTIRTTVKLALIIVLLRFLIVYLKELLTIAGKIHNSLNFGRFAFLAVILISLGWYFYLKLIRKNHNLKSVLVPFFLLILYEVGIQMISVFIFRVNLQSDWSNLFIAMNQCIIFLLLHTIDCFCEFASGDN